MIVLALGTNDWGNENTAYKGILKAVEKALLIDKNVVLIIPNKSIHGLSYAYNAALRVTKEKNIKSEYPQSWSPGSDSFHISIQEAKRLKEKYKDAVIWGDSNAVRLGAKQGVTGFIGKSASYIADRIK